ncbi:MAG: DUF1501 domain-containing protein [Planctomycetota bacterium]|nr:DUF1501 domain-containing protein [Planctomycetota bacterium]
MNHNFFSRRQMLKTVSAGFGYTALQGIAAQAAANETKEINPSGPLGAKKPHFPARAKRVIFLCMRGGPSHMETFDPKPKLSADNGKVAKNQNSKLLGSRWKFSKHGQSGIEIVDLLPETSKHADKLCILRGMHTDNENHPQALEQMHTGSFQFIRPSLGSWTLYGLGSENQNLPGFISINPLTSLGGLRYYSSAFLPAANSATLLGDANRPIPNPVIGNVSNNRLAINGQRQQLDLLQEMNRELLGRDQDSRIEGLIQSYELAFRMQGALPKVMDVASESKSTLARYNANETFGRQCLLARRFAEAGVRFIEITHTDWDHHGFLTGGMTKNCAIIDKPIAALLEDLDNRGMLDDTLVIWGGEFGRTPDDPTSDGRGHNNKGFSMWLAGGGVKSGLAYGATDEYGYEAVEGKVHTHDLHATILHLLGLDHEKLTYKHGGRDFRLTDVHGKVVKDILA